MAPSLGESSSAVADRVAAARSLAAGRGVDVNADLPASSLAQWAPLDADAAAPLERAVRSGRLSARGLHRVHRLARTIADLDGGALTIAASHMAEALFLRGDRSILLGEDSR